MNEGGVDGHGRVYSCAEDFGIMYKHREVDRMRAMSSKGSGTRQQCSIGTARRQPIMEAYAADTRAKEQGRSLVAADCGAGIGRVTGSLLLHYFDQVDLVEPSGHLLETAKRNLVESKPKYSSHSPSLGNNVFDGRGCCSILSAVRLCNEPQGVIFLKENVCDNGFIVDSDDCSITRSHSYFVELFKKAGVRIAHSALQKNFPKQLFKVRMYALRFD
eukprot:jgi/Picre1/35111/NNA_002574.t1